MDLSSSTQSYHENLIESLKDQKEAAAYLLAALEEDQAGIDMALSHLKEAGW